MEISVTFEPLDGFSNIFAFYLSLSSGIAYNNSTSNLTDHMKRHHKKDFDQAVSALANLLTKRRLCMTGSNVCAQLFQKDNLEI